MADSAKTTTTNDKRERRNQTYLAKKGEALSIEAIRDNLFMECGCDPQCMYTVINELDDAVQFCLDLRRKRFAGVMKNK